MALETTLDILQRAADELGLDRPVSTAASGDAQARQLHASLNSTGRELMRGHTWGSLHKLATLTTVLNQADYALPADYHRMVSDTHWDQTNHWRMYGPDTPQMDRFRRDSAVGNIGIRRIYRQVGSKIRIYPTPTVDGETLSFEYISRNWALANDGTAKEEMDADTDTSVFSPDLLVKGVKWSFLSAKGMYAEALKAEYDALRDLEVAADLGGTVLNMDGGCEGEGLIGLDNVRDGSWSL